MRRSWRKKHELRWRRLASDRNACASMAGEGHRDRDEFEREIPNFERGYQPSAGEEQGGGNASSGGEEQLPASMAGEGRHEREDSNSGPYVPYYNGGLNPYVETYICPVAYVGPSPPVGPLEAYTCPIMFGSIETCICPAMSADVAPSPNLIGGPPRVVSGYGGASASRLVLKVLCPCKTTGHVIGSGGTSIKSIQRETGTAIIVEDDPRGSNNVITVTSTESLGVASMAVEAVLLLQQKMYDHGNRTLRLLVPAEVVGCIIGREGSTITTIRETTNTKIHISREDKAPTWADGDELVVEISGPVENLREALIQIVLRLRDNVLSSGRYRYRASSRGGRPMRPYGRGHNRTWGERGGHQ